MEVPALRHEPRLHGPMPVGRAALPPRRPVKLAHLVCVSHEGPPNPQRYAGRFIGPVKSIHASWSPLERGRYSLQIRPITFAVVVLDVDDETLGKIIREKVFVLTDRIPIKKAGRPVRELPVLTSSDLRPTPAALLPDKERGRGPDWMVGAIRRHEIYRQSLDGK